MDQLTEYQKYTNYLVANGSRDGQSLRELPVDEKDRRDVQRFAKKRIVKNAYDLAKARHEEQDNVFKALQQVREEISREAARGKGIMDKAQGLVRQTLHKTPDFVGRETSRRAKKLIDKRSYTKGKIARAVLAALALVGIGIGYDKAVENKVIPDIPGQIRDKTDELSSNVKSLIDSPITTIIDKANEIRAAEEATKQNMVLWNRLITNPATVFSERQLDIKNPLSIQLIGTASEQSASVILVKTHGPVWWKVLLDPYPTTGDPNTDEEIEVARQKALKIWMRQLGESDIEGLKKYIDNPDKVWSRLKDIGAPEYIVALYRMRNDLEKNDFGDFEKWKKGKYEEIQSRPYVTPEGMQQYFNPDGNDMSRNDLTPTQKARALIIKGKTGQNKNSWKSNRA